MGDSRKRANKVDRNFPVKRSSPLKLVLDPELQLSLQQTQQLAMLNPEDRQQIIGDVLGPKLEVRWVAEGIDKSPIVLKRGKETINLASEYLLVVHMLPIIGEQCLF